jgi:hypothetical protein
MICLQCKKNVSQIYGENVDGKYKEACWKCLYPKKK